MDEQKQEPDLAAQVKELKDLINAVGFGFQGMAAHLMEVSGRVSMLEQGMDAIYGATDEEETVGDA